MITQPVSGGPLRGFEQATPRWAGWCADGPANTPLITGPPGKHRPRDTAAARHALLHLHAQGRLEPPGTVTRRCGSTRANLQVLLLQDRALEFLKGAVQFRAVGATDCGHGQPPHPCLEASPLPDTLWDTQP